MKQSFNFDVESVTITAAKIPVTLKGIKISAECECDPEEIAAAGSVISQTIEQLAEKFGWLKPLIEKEINISIHNRELLSKDFEKKIAEGKAGAYGPNGWFAKSATEVTSEPYDPNKDYGAKVTNVK